MNTTAETKTQEQIFALWRRRSKGGLTYFSGVNNDKTKELVAFYNTDKKNMKEPDLKVYSKVKEDDELSQDAFVVLWCNTTKNNKKILSGQIDGKKVVGFINEEADDKHPYISVYWSKEKEEPKQDEKKKPKKRPSIKQLEAVEVEEADLPF